MLENIIWHTLNEAEEIAEAVRENFGIEGIAQVMTNENKKNSYENFPTDTYIGLVKELEKKLEDYKNPIVEQDKKFFKELKKLRKVSNIIKKIEKEGTIASGIDWEEFKDYYGTIKFEASKLSIKLSLLSRAIGEIIKIKGDLGVIKRLENLNIYTDNKLTEKTLIDMINEKINRSRAIKILTKKPEETNKQTNTYIESSKNKLGEKGIYKPIEYPKEEILFLGDRRINKKKAKAFLDNKNYEKIKCNMLEIEKIFEGRNVSKTEAYKIYSRYPKVLEGKNSEAKDYQSALEDLLETYSKDDGSVLKGILPSQKIKKYESIESIRSLIKKDKPKVYIQGLTLIDNRKNRDNIETQLLANPFNTGRRVIKKSKIVNSSLYDTCAKERNHKGHFRREALGSKRVIFEVIRNDDDTFTVEIFKYFKTHQEYDAFYKH